MLQWLGDGTTSFLCILFQSNKDSNQVFFWKKGATDEQEVVAADVIQEVKVGFLEARLLGPEPHTRRGG